MANVRQGVHGIVGLDLTARRMRDVRPAVRQEMLVVSGGRMGLTMGRVQRLVRLGCHRDHRRKREVHREQRVEQDAPKWSTDERWTLHGSAPYTRSKYDD